MTLEDRFDTMLFRIRSRLSGKKRSSSVDLIVDEFNENNDTNGLNNNADNKAYASLGPISRRDGYNFGPLGDSIRRSINNDLRRRHRRRSGGSLSASQRSRRSARTNFKRNDVAEEPSPQKPLSSTIFGDDNYGNELSTLLTTIDYDNNNNILGSNGSIIKELDHVCEAAVDVGSDLEDDPGYLLTRLPSVKANPAANIDDAAQNQQNSIALLSPYPSPNEDHQWSESLRELERTIRDVIKNSESVMHLNVDESYQSNAERLTPETRSHAPVSRQQSRLLLNGSIQSLQDQNDLELKRENGVNASLKEESKKGKRLFSFSTNSLFRRDKKLTHSTRRPLDSSPAHQSLSPEQITHPVIDLLAGYVPNTSDKLEFHESTYFPVIDTQPPVILQRRRNNQRRETNRYGGYVPPERRESRDSIGLLYNNTNTLALAENASLTTVLDANGEQYHEIEIDIRRESSGYDTGGAGTTVGELTEPDDPLSKSTSPNTVSPPRTNAAMPLSSLFAPPTRKIHIDVNENQWPTLERRAEMPKLDACIITRPRIIDPYDEHVSYEVRKMAITDNDKTTAVSLHQIGSGAPPSSFSSQDTITRDYNRALMSNHESINDVHSPNTHTTKHTFVTDKDNRGYGISVTTSHDEANKADQPSGSLKVFKIFGVPVHRRRDNKEKSSSRMRSSASPKSLQALNKLKAHDETIGDDVSLTSSVTVPWWNASITLKRKDAALSGSPLLMASLQDEQDRQRRYRYTDLAKSEQHLNRLHRSLSASTAAAYDGAIDFLRDRIKETKYVTAVFESATGGLAPILPDTVKEFRHWLGPNSRLLAVACEVHWSVPERQRSRAMEIKLKDNLHRALRDNNKRVLNLYDECRDGKLPSSFIESKTEESCARDAAIDAFQGIYRRYYPELLMLQDPKTIHSHKSYWTLDNPVLRADDQVNRRSLLPAPAKFLHRSMAAAQLERKSVVAINMATLRLEGDATNYDAERLSLGSQKEDLIG